MDEKEYIPKGANIDYSFFKTEDDKIKFLKEIKENTINFIKEQDLRKAKSYATAQTHVYI